MRTHGSPWVPVFVMAAVSGLLAQQPRDNRPGGPIGTALIAGRVVTQDAEARPVRKAIVTLRSDDGRVQRAAIADDAGAFVFAELPAGRYGLEAARHGWPRIALGASRPHQRGTPINVAAGQQMTGATIRMPRGAVLTGTIVDHAGHPLAHTTIVAYRLSYRNGERRLARYREVQTDERGGYRLFGLAAGEYAVATSGPPSAFADVDEIYASGEVDVGRSLAGSRRARLPRLGVDGAPLPTALGYAPVYYPGTSFRAEATLIPVGAGEERSSLDFEVGLAQTLPVGGYVNAPRGVPLQSVTVVLRALFDDVSGVESHDDRRAVPGSDGSFLFSRVPPGRYELAATTTPRGPVNQELWGTASVTVAGDHVPSTTVTLQPTLTLSGRAAFEGESAPRPDGLQIRIELVPLSGGGRRIAEVAASGNFTIAGLIPGRHWLTANVSGARPERGWALKSAVINGADALDAPLDLRSGGSEALVTFTDRIATLSGSVQDAAGRPAPEHFVVVFSANPRFWFPMSRRVRAVRPTLDGRYEFDNLAPGEYFITTVRDVEDGEWYDRAWLQGFAASAARISIAEGDKQIRDLRVE